MTLGTEQEAAVGYMEKPTMIGPLLDHLVFIPPDWGLHQSKHH